MRRLVVIGGWAVALAALAAWFVFLRPVALGGDAGYILINGESMLPDLRNGDLVLIRQEPSYRVGEVITFRVPEGTLGAGVKIIHRIVGGDARSGFVVQGDNKPHVDPWKPLPEDVVGKLWAHLPGVGNALRLVRSQAGIAGFAALMAVWTFWGGKPRRSDVQPAVPEASA
ncbi:MAG: signal peptidase I [Actinomycetota bacterium]